MSFAAKLTLGVSVTATLGIISYVHIKQIIDRQKLHEGVIRDVERQQMRKIENLHMLQKQIQVTQQLKNEMLAESGDSR